ncbi:MAG: hypothetical protein MI861_11610 [Pirellulales bacterium]|nr:hypothetical protein [Pirellulales bacterium]
MARSNSANLDQLCSYDGLQRLIDFQQGQLNAGNTSASSKTLTQERTGDGKNWRACTLTPAWVRRTSSTDHRLQCRGLGGQFACWRSGKLVSWWSLHQNHSSGVPK